MFVELEIEDLIPILPRNITSSQNNVLISALDEKYEGNYIKDVGVFVMTTKILNILSKAVPARDMYIHFKVQFRAVFFQPYVGEVLEGTVFSQDETGIRVVLGFFNNVFIPAENLFEGCEYYAQESVWRWWVNEDFHYLDNGCRVCLTVQEILHQNVHPSILLSQATQKQDASTPFVISQTQFCVIGKMNDSGHGDVRWWE